MICYYVNSIILILPGYLIILGIFYPFFLLCYVVISVMHFINVFREVLYK